ncbi:MAG: TonB-dependent receptor [candidate division WOR-3 bacterium]|nr:MAG: TonB-dependent receptor [candidate division WOR-3 bacterium]
MIQKIIVAVSTVFFICGNVIFSQTMDRNPGGIISGRVLDADLGRPVEYANVVLFALPDSMQLTGTVTDHDGNFLLTGIRPGRYYLEVSFMGLQTRIINNIIISPTAMEVNLDDILLETTVIALEGTEVTAERPALTYEIDKKVINVSKQTTATSGTAVDVLENVPSVDVDIEGNVSLRGSSNFTVLIDGRPTVLEPSEALQQIPAGSIESIEIITNPSAKYDPDGIAGIINVIMKKKSLVGFSGITNLNLGLNEKYGGDVLTSHRTGSITTYMGVDYRHWYFPGTRETENMTFLNDTSSFSSSTGDLWRTWNPYGVRAGMDIDLGASDNVSLGARYGKRSMEHRSRVDYDEWSEPGDGHTLYLSESDQEHQHRFLSVTADFQHYFSPKKHRVTLQTYFHDRSGSESTLTQLFDSTGAITSGQQSTETSPGRSLRVNLDYTRPFREDDKLEAGYAGRFDRSEDTNELYVYDTLSGVFEFASLYSHTTDYARDIHALYAMYAGKWYERMGYQVGLRGEYVDRITRLDDESQEFLIDRWDYFPTVHLSYELTDGKQFMASYSRRIQRPREWWLEPFLTWTDAYNVRQGNPDLKPEYKNSIEFGFSTLLGKSLVSTEAYYRITDNKVERIRSVYDDNVILHSVDNVGTDYALGVELMLDMKMIDWWNVNCMTNFYHYRIQSDLDNDTEEDFNWSVRVNNEFKLTSSTKLQVNGRYRSPSVSSQGTRQGYFMTDAALKQEFFKKRFSITLQVRDILRTGSREFRSEGADFYSYMYMTRESPIFMLNLSYNFNNYKPDRRRDEGEQEFEGSEDM